jgi:hypothetical protein
MTSITPADTRAIPANKITFLLFASGYQLQVLIYILSLGLKCQEIDETCLGTLQTRFLSSMGRIYFIEAL